MTPRKRVPLRGAPPPGRAHYHRQRRTTTPQGPHDSLAAAIARYVSERPLLDWAARVTRVKRSSAYNGGEWHGPCPICGGKDRFHVYPTPREGRPYAWCRRCERGGDALNWDVRLAGQDPGVPGTVSAYLRARGYLAEPEKPKEAKG